MPCVPRRHVWPTGLTAVGPSIQQVVHQILTICHGPGASVERLLELNVGQDHLTQPEQLLLDVVEMALFPCLHQYRPYGKHLQGIRHGRHPDPSPGRGLRDDVTCLGAHLAVKKVVHEGLSSLDAGAGVADGTPKFRVRIAQVNDREKLLGKFRGCLGVLNELVKVLRQDPR